VPERVTVLPLVSTLMSNAFTLSSNAIFALIFAVIPLLFNARRA
jgi:hypothetical protein